jgi:hypothetical protein
MDESVEMFRAEQRRLAEQGDPATGVHRQTRKRRLELALWLAYCILISGTFILLRTGGPRWAMNALVGAMLVIFIPLIFLVLQREWRKFWGR